jgi:hypothetical protein
MVDPHVPEVFPWHLVPPHDSARMSPTVSQSQDLLDRLEKRHDELLERLDDLNGRIEKALADLAQARATSTPSA